LGFNAIGVKGKLFSFISSEGSHNIGKGSFYPFPANPKRQKFFLCGVRGGELTLLDLRRRPLAKSARGDTIPSHPERSEGSPPFMFFGGSIEGCF